MWVLELEPGSSASVLTTDPLVSNYNVGFNTNHTFSVPRTGLIIPLSPLTPQSPPLPPGLPTYEQALAASGVHDAPPPPYSRYEAGLVPGWCQREGEGEATRGRGVSPRAGLGALENLHGAGFAGQGGPYAIVYRGVDQPFKSAAFQEGGACAYRIEDWLRHQGRVGVGSVEGAAEMFDSVLYTPNPHPC